MRLILLGTTGYHPNDQRHTACFMLPDCGVVLDAGTAMFRVRDHLCTDTLDIFLTHAHLDHVVGLTFLYDVLWERTMRHVAVHAAADKLTAIRRDLFSNELFPAPPQFEFSPLTERVVLWDGGIVSHFPLEHPGGSVGFRIDWPGKSLAYVTDTTARMNADYIERIRGVDVLVHECTFPDGWEERASFTGHSCTTPVAQVAAAAGVGKLILVHVNPMSQLADPVGLAAARAVFPAVDLGYDNMVIEF